MFIFHTYTVISIVGTYYKICFDDKNNTIKIDQQDYQNL